MIEQAKSNSKRRSPREPKTAEGPSTHSLIVAAPQASNKPAAQSKIGEVIRLLKREAGATLDQMVEATGWQSHTTRAALTGLKKNGYTVERRQCEGTSVYRVTAGPA